jgi:hypothetical protein
MGFVIKFWLVDTNAKLFVIMGHVQLAKLHKASLVDAQGQYKM